MHSVRVERCVVQQLKLALLLVIRFVSTTTRAYNAVRIFGAGQLMALD